MSCSQREVHSFTSMAGSPKWRYCRWLVVVLMASVRSSLASRTRRTLAANWAEMDSPEVRARPEVVEVRSRREVVHGQEAVGFQDSPVDYDAVVTTIAFGSCSKPEDPQVWCWGCAAGRRGWWWVTDCHPPRGRFHSHLPSITLARLHGCGRPG